MERPVSRRGSKQSLGKEITLTVADAMTCLARHERSMSWVEMIGLAVRSMIIYLRILKHFGHIEFIYGGLKLTMEIRWSNLRAATYSR